MAYYMIDKPSAYPESAPPGPVLLTVPVTSLVDYHTIVTIQIRVFEGSIFPGSGRILDTLVEYYVGLPPSVKTDVHFMHNSELTSQSRRDIEVSIWQGDIKFEEDSWDDVFYVVYPEEPPPEEPDQILEIDITGGYGHVETSPASIEGKSVWYDNDTGTFLYGTKVKVTAYPDFGYEFEKWTDEIEGGVNTNNPAFVKPMTEHRAVKCHFRVIEEDLVWPLEIDITPSEGGFVETSPASIEGREVWHDDNIGTFEEGTIVRVTAIPNDGYQFVKWTDEIQGGVSFSNPASVKPMTELRTVKCHFGSVEEPPPPPPPPPPPEEEEPEEMNWPLIAGVAGGALLLVGIAVASKKK